MTTKMKLTSCVLLAGLSAVLPAALLRAAPPTDSSPTLFPDGHYQLCTDSSGHYSLLDTRTGRVWTTQSNSGDWKQVMNGIVDK